MIKRIYYYFKLKELLEKFELMPFVNYLMKLQHRSLFQMCMNTNVIRWWFDSMACFKCTYHDLLPKAQAYSKYNTTANRIVERFFRAQDIWRKQKID